MDDYQRYLLDEAKRQRELIKEASSSAVKAAAKAQKAQADAHTVEEKSKAENRRMDSPKHGGKTPAAKSTSSSKSFKRELELVEARMNVLNGEGAALEVRLAALPLPSEIADIGKRLKVVNDELKTLEDQWLELSEKAQAVAA